jgi:hypothetical protein
LDFSRDFDSDALQCLGQFVDPSLLSGGMIDQAV